MTQRGALLCILGIVVAAAASHWEAAPALLLQETRSGGLDALYPWPEDPDNLVANPSFERRDGSGNLIDWRIGSPSHLFPDGRTAYSGSFSLRLKDSHESRFTPAALQNVSLPAGWFRLGGWAKAERAGSNQDGSGGRITLETSRSGRRSTAVVSGSTEWRRLSRVFSIGAPDPGARMRIEAYRKPNGDVFFDDVSLHRLTPPLVEGFLLYPNYRGILFDDLSSTIELQVTVRPEEAGLGLGDLDVRVSIEDGTRVVQQQRLEPPSRSFTVSLDASGLALGPHFLRIEGIRRANGAVLFEYPLYRIVKLSAQERPALGIYVDADQNLVVQGKPRFALGIYDAYLFEQGDEQERIAKIAEAPFNLYLNYWINGESVPVLTRLMDVLQSYGMSYLHTINTWYESHGLWHDSWQCGGRTAASLGETGFTSCMVQALGAHPALAGWYTADEQPVERLDPVFGQYEVLRSSVRGGVSFIAQNSPSELSRWRDAADAFDLHQYPIFNVPEGTLSPLEEVYEYTEAAVAAVEASRPVWTVIQFFQHGSRGHWPTYDELRAMSYLAITAGARGLFYWSYGGGGLWRLNDASLREQYWQRLVRLTKEIHALESALVAPDAPELLARVSPAGKIKVAARQVGRTTYVIAVNATPEDGLVGSFTLAGGGSTRLEVLNENRSVDVRQGAFTDRFASYGVHVYKLQDR